MQSNYVKNLSNKRKITIDNNYLQKFQTRFALVTILIPAIGSLLAIGLLWFSEINRIEIFLLITMYGLTLMGITVGFHRYFAHSSFETNSLIKIILAILGSMAAQGPVIQWVSNHRRHHQYSDRKGDVHSPHIQRQQKLTHWKGLWHAHIGWMLKGEISNSALFARDLLQDPTITKINQLYLLWVTIGIAIPTLLGGVLSTNWIGAFQGFLWGGMLRIFLAHHATWSINSFTHLYGQRHFSTSEQSTNNIWLAIPTLGEAWHNNHHAFANSAKFGFKWWQVDLGYWVIRLLEAIGLAWNVKIPTAAMIEAKKVAQRA